MTSGTTSPARKATAQIIDKKLNFLRHRRRQSGQAVGLGARINMIMQDGLLHDLQDPDAGGFHSGKSRRPSKDTYGGKGDKVVNMNYQAVDAATQAIAKVDYPLQVTSTSTMPPPVPDDAPEFVQTVIGPIIGRSW